MNLSHDYAIGLLKSHGHALEAKAKLYEKKIDQCTVEGNKPESLDYFHTKLTECTEQQIYLQHSISQLENPIRW